MAKTTTSLIRVLASVLMWTPVVTGFTNGRYMATGRSLMAPPPLPTQLSATTSNVLFRSTTEDSLLNNNRHSASDWFYNVRSILQSEILREVRGPVLAVAGWSAAVSIVHKLLLCSSLPSLAAHMSIPGTAHSFLVSALGLLLVFRTNSAYQRFNVSFLCFRRMSPKLVHARFTVSSSHSPTFYYFYHHQHRRAAKSGKTF